MSSKIYGNESFMLKSGDGIGDIDIQALLKFHKINKKYANVTSVQPSGRFDAFNLDNNKNILSFQ